MRIQAHVGAFKHHAAGIPILSRAFYEGVSMRPALPNAHPLQENAKDGPPAGLALNSDISITEPQGILKDGSTRQRPKKDCSVSRGCRNEQASPLKRGCGCQARVDLKRALLESACDVRSWCERHDICVQFPDQNSGNTARCPVMRRVSSQRSGTPQPRGGPARSQRLWPAPREYERP
jgi:hypothetical protein